MRSRSIILHEFHPLKEENCFCVPALLPFSFVFDIVSSSLHICVYHYIVPFIILLFLIIFIPISTAILIFYSFLSLCTQINSEVYVEMNSTNALMKKETLESLREAESACSMSSAEAGM